MNNLPFKWVLNSNYSSFNSSYTGSRQDILKLTPLSAIRILDVGCSTGELGRAIKKRQNVTVFGIEYCKEMASVANKYLDRVICGDAEKIISDNDSKLGKFDCIILADILEHLNQPWDLLKRATNLLNNDGVIIMSIPNIQFYDTLINIIFKGYFPYRKRGIHDITHLRFFAYKNIIEMIKNANLHIVRIEKNYRIVESPHWINNYGKLLFLFGNFFVFQYLIVSKRN